jgi:hypothetical protein
MNELKSGKRLIGQLECEIGEYRSKDPFLSNKKEGVNQVELALR